MSDVGEEVDLKAVEGSRWDGLNKLTTLIQPNRPRML